MIRELKKLSDFLDALGKAAGLTFAWHFVNQEWMESVLPGQREHASPFCRAVRSASSRAYLRKCIGEHHEYEFLQALKLRRPFVIRCHAGAMELAVPVFLGEEFVGVLCAGTFRGSGLSGCPECEKLYQQLPAVREEALERWGEVLSELAGQFLDGIALPVGNSPLLKQTLATDTRILKAIIYLRNHFTRRVTAAETARAAGVSPSWFLHLFPAQTGYGFSDFLQRLRVEHARRLAEGSDLPFGEIARSSGIMSQSRMGVLFRRYLKMSPRELRRHSGEVRGMPEPARRER